MRLLLLLALLLLPAAGARAAEQVVDLPTRPGQHVRLLLDRPAGTPRGAVVLLAGGHGHLGLSPQGQIGWGEGNMLVRSRAHYVAAGFVTAVPDMGSDIPIGQRGRFDYRASPEHAADIGTIIRHLRSSAAGASRRVAVVGTSAGAVSAANAAARLQGDAAPDALVISSGLLLALRGGATSVQGNVPNLETIRQPVLFLHHTADPCAGTPPEGPRQLAPSLRGARRVDIAMLSGGSMGRGDPCGAFSAHGFPGQEQEVTTRTAEWLLAQWGGQ